MTSTHWRGFLFCQLLGLGLLASWLCPVTRPLWDSLDNAVFFALNGTLAPRSLWGAFWALLSFRALDLLPLFALAPFLLVPNLLIPRAQRTTACVHLFLLLVLLLVLRLAVKEVTQILDYGRISPSRVLQPVVFLSQLYPEFDPKDGSNWSFPGDHASVLIVVAAYMLLLKINHWSPVIVATATLFILPRLFAGAHWFSDVAVGGTLIASQAIAFGCFTPWPGRWAERLAAYASPWIPARWR